MFGWILGRDAVAAAAQQDTTADEGMMPGEDTPLIAESSSTSTPSSSTSSTTSKQAVYEFLEAQTSGGRIYEAFMIGLIALNVLAFIVGSLFVKDYNPDFPYECDSLCDALWFGNDSDNALSFLNIGATSVLEIGTVLVFSVEYGLRLWVCDLESPNYQGIVGRLYYIPTFFSLVDLASTLPFYIDSFLLRDQDIAASSFVRMFRLLRMMRVEGRYDTVRRIFLYFYCIYSTVVSIFLHPVSDSSTFV